MPVSRGLLAWTVIAILFLTGPLSAQQPAAPAGKLVQDIWETAYLDGFRVGYMHFSVEEISPPSGHKYLRAARDLNFSVRRGADVARIKALTGTNELPDGKVLGVFMQQRLSENVIQDLRGTVEGDQLRVKAIGQQANFEKVLPWNPKVVGNLGELNLLKIHKPKPGDAFDYMIYEPIVNAIVTIRVKAEAYEVVAIGAERPKLLRLAAVPDKFSDVQLPSQLLWVDSDFEVRRSTSVMPGMGYLVVDRTTKADATRPLNPSQLPDIMDRQSIKLSQRIAWAHSQNKITYRITMPGDDEPAKTLAQDNRQKIANVQGKTFDLVVTAVRQPPTIAPAAAIDPGKEFIVSNYFITSDDEVVKQHAAKATAGKSEPWDKAQAVERWVHQNMKVQNFTEEMAPASEVARTMTGDCTEYSMLAAAMCRAAGVPSRTAIGLVYVDNPRQPLLGFHMWTEVFVRGQWVSIDATLGQGNVGPAHVKITDASWFNTQSMTPLLPVMRVMIGRPTVTVLEVK